MYPDDSIQSMVAPWWVAERGDLLSRGRLVYTYAQHAEPHPFLLTAEAKKEPSDPSRVRLRLEPFQTDDAPRAPSPPTPALPFEAGEAWSVRRVRRRPCLVLGVSGPAVHRPARTAVREAHGSPALLVAPYYDAAGLDAGFVARVRRAEYPHCVWDRLPMEGEREVILRLDLMQPMGRDPLGFDWTEHALSAGALAVLDAWVGWSVMGVLGAGDLGDFRELVRGG